jgi:hypothetical protein
MKAIPSCGGDILNRHSRVAGFDDIFDYWTLDVSVLF